MKELIGWKLVFGIPGPEADAETVSLFRKTGARGLILYRRNFRSVSQIKKLISGLEDKLGRRLLVCLDHEGGRVVFFGDGVTVFPDNYCFGRLGSPAAVRRQGEIEAAELRALGVDVNFAPVADVLTKTYNPGILSRSYGESPEKTAAFVAARVAGLQRGAVSAAVKHFPGKGHAVLDAHLKLPVINSTLKEMEKTHLKPFFAAIEAGTDCVMSSHPVYAKIDSEVPATFSRKIITGLLREKYGFGGVIVSDDLEMGALSSRGGAEKAVVLAEKAGHDLLLVCHCGPAQLKAWNSLLKAYETGELKKSSLELSVERIRRLHEKRKKRYEGKPGPLSEGAVLASRAAEKSVRIISRGNCGLPLKLSRFSGKKSVLVFPRFSDMEQLLMFEPEAKDLGKYFLAKNFARGFKPELCPVPMTPSEADVEKTAALLSDAELAVVFVWDAGLIPGWRKIVEAAQSRAKNRVFILLRDFFDARFVSPSSAAATAYGFRKCQLDSVCSKVFI